MGQTAYVEGMDRHAFGSGPLFRLKRVLTQNAKKDLTRNKMFPACSIQSTDFRQHSGNTLQIPYDGTGLSLEFRRMRAGASLKRTD